MVCNQKTNDEPMSKIDEQWVRVDVEGLARKLAEHSWEIDTKLISSRDLWVKMVKENGEVVDEVHSQWSTLYWNLVDEYKNLILMYADIEKRTPTGPEGADL